MAFVTVFNQVYQTVKNILHIIQALLAFIAAMMTIAVLTAPPKPDIRILYFFVLCLFCLPFLLYQSAFPSVKRLKRYSNAYAHLIIDTALTILFTTTFIGEVVWVQKGTKAAPDFQQGNTICKVFGYGPTDKCDLGHITSIVGVTLCALFAITTALSIYGTIHYRKTGFLPGSDSTSRINRTIRNDDVLEFSTIPYDSFDIPLKNINKRIRSPPPPSKPRHSQDSEIRATLPERPLHPVFTPSRLQKSVRWADEGSSDVDGEPL